MKSEVFPCVGENVGFFGSFSLCRRKVMEWMDGVGVLLGLLMWTCRYVDKRGVLVYNRYVYLEGTTR